MVRNDSEIYTSYSKEFPFWIINSENKPTIEAFNDFRYNKMTFYYGNEDLFRYSENTYDRLTILSKDPDIKYIWLDRTSSTPIVQKPFLYEESGYYLERVSFYSTGVWKMEFKRDFISFWLQFLYNVRDNNLGNIRTLTTRTNLIGDNYQFEDEKLKTLPLKISGWKVEELTPANDILTKTKLDKRKTRVVIDYNKMKTVWESKLGNENYKTGIYTFELELIESGKERTSFQEYYVFNTEEYGMVYIPKVNYVITNAPGDITPYGYISIAYNDPLTNGSNPDFLRIYHPSLIEKHLVNNKWASQFMGVFILPNWLTTSIPTGRLVNDITVSNFTFTNLINIGFGIDTRQILSINYQIPDLFKIEKINKLNVNNKLVSQSILQSLPTYLNYINQQINFQKYPDYFDFENNILRFEYDFIFTGMGNNTYYTKYETVDNWLKTLPGQLPSSTSKFAQYIQANQNVLQTGIWVKQEEAKINQATGIANAMTGVAGAGLSLFGMTNIIGVAKDALTKAYASSTGSLGVAHGLNQAVQGITNAIRAENEVKFEKARVKAKYADTFNSSTRQINYAQSIDALSKEFLEAKVCDIIIHPIIDNKVVYNDTIVRCGNKTYEYFKLNDLLTISEDKKYNYFEVNSENFYKETTNYQKIWDHFTFEEISQILDWLEEGIRIWNTKDIEYDYQE